MGLYTKRYFIYTNSNRLLQENVRKCIYTLLGDVKFSVGTSIGGTPRYQFSNNVGKYLENQGAPVGSNVLQKTEVPNWIMEGNDKIKSAFLGALFDDDGGFRADDCKQICFKLSKDSSLSNELEVFLEQIMSLLNDLKIETSGIRNDRVYVRPSDKRNMTSLRFWITGRKNFSFFQKNVNILHPEKKEKLILMAHTR